MRIALAVAVLVAAAGLPARADIVIKKDGTRVEGEVTEKGGTVTVKTKRGRTRIPKSDVKMILRTSTDIVDRLKAHFRGRDLMLIASRAGRRMPLEEAEKLVSRMKAAADPMAEVDRALEQLRLTPKHAAEIVKKNVEAFEKEFKVKAHESIYYHVLTNLGPAWEQKIANYMDGIFQEYQKRLVFGEKITQKFVVKVYATQAEYVAHGAMPQSAAYYNPSKRELVGYKQQTDDRLFQSLYHEGMHQFLMFYVPNPPMWFNEGLAKYFQTARPMRGIRSAKAPRYNVSRKDPGMVRYAKYHKRGGKFSPLSHLIKMERPEFYGPNIGINYAQAWAFTHFLLESGSPQLKKWWIDYFYALRDGATQAEANEKVFGKVNMQMLERMFDKYVDSM
ncbi:MAG: DUF1570 domain-containing protein [Planctomycetota bacterium]